MFCLDPNEQESKGRQSQSDDWDYRVATPRMNDSQSVADNSEFAFELRAHDFSRQWCAGQYDRRSPVHSDCHPETP